MWSGGYCLLICQADSHNKTNSIFPVFGKAVPVSSENWFEIRKSCLEKRRFIPENLISNHISGDRCSQMDWLCPVLYGSYSFSFCSATIQQRVLKLPYSPVLPAYSLFLLLKLWICLEPLDSLLVSGLVIYEEAWLKSWSQNWQISHLLTILGSIWNPFQDTAWSSRKLQIHSET